MCGKLNYSLSKVIKVENSRDKRTIKHFGPFVFIAQVLIDLKAFPWDMGNPLCLISLLLSICGIRQSKSNMPITNTLTGTCHISCVIIERTNVSIPRRLRPQRTSICPPDPVTNSTFQVMLFVKYQ